MTMQSGICTQLDSPPSAAELAELVRTIQKTNLRKTSLSKLVIQS